jgi:hypothetical protein
MSGESDQEAREQEEFERKILEGLDSSVREVSTEEWEDLRSTLRNELDKRRRKAP